MTGNITWEMIATVMALFVFISGIWARVSGQIKAAEEAASLRALGAQTKADIVATELAAYKLHVVEHYASKNGVTSQFDAVTKSIDSIGDRMEKRLDGMNERLDRVIEAGQKPAPRSRAIS